MNIYTQNVNFPDVWKIYIIHGKMNKRRKAQECAGRRSGLARRPRTGGLLRKRKRAALQGYPLQRLTGKEHRRASGQGVRLYGGDFSAVRKNTTACPLTAKAACVKSVGTRRRFFRAQTWGRYGERGERRAKTGEKSKKNGQKP